MHPGRQEGVVGWAVDGGNEERNGMKSIFLSPFVVYYVSIYKYIYIYKYISI